MNIESENGWWTVYNDYAMLPGPRRSLSADLALLEPNRVVLAVEFQYEPCHRRHDVLTNKLPVTAWKDMLKDPDRVRQFVDEGKAEVRYAAVIDEGGHLTRRDLALYADRQAWRVPTARARLRDGTTWDPAPLLADREPLTGKPDNSDD